MEPSEAIELFNVPARSMAETPQKLLSGINAPASPVSSLESDSEEENQVNTLSGINISASPVSSLSSEPEDSLSEDEEVNTRYHNGHVENKAANELLTEHSGRSKRKAAEQSAQATALQYQDNPLDGLDDDYDDYLSEREIDQAKRTPNKKKVKKQSLPHGNKGGRKQPTKKTRLKLTPSQRGLNRRRGSRRQNTATRVTADPAGEGEETRSEATKNKPRGRPRASATQETALEVKGKGGENSIEPQAIQPGSKQRRGRSSANVLTQDVAAPVESKGKDKDKDIEETEEQPTQSPKRTRGRPKNIPQDAIITAESEGEGGSIGDSITVEKTLVIAAMDKDVTATEQHPAQSTKKRKRGRPKKSLTQDAAVGADSEGGGTADTIIVENLINATPAAPEEKGERQPIQSTPKKRRGRPPRHPPPPDPPVRPESDGEGGGVEESHIIVTKSSNTSSQTRMTKPNTPLPSTNQKRNVPNDVSQSSAARSHGKALNRAVSDTSMEAPSYNLRSKTSTKDDQQKDDLTANTTRAESQSLTLPSDTQSQKQAGTKRRRSGPNLQNESSTSEGTAVQSNGMEASPGDGDMADTTGDKPSPKKRLRLESDRTSSSHNASGSDSRDLPSTSGVLKDIMTEVHSKEASPLHQVDRSIEMQSINPSSPKRQQTQSEELSEQPVTKKRKLQVAGERESSAVTFEGLDASATNPGSSHINQTTGSQYNTCVSQKRKDTQSEVPKHHVARKRKNGDHESTEVTPLDTPNREVRPGGDSVEVPVMDSRDASIAPRKTSPDTLVLSSVHSPIKDGTHSWTWSLTNSQPTCWRAPDGSYVPIDPSHRQYVTVETPTLWDPSRMVKKDLPRHPRVWAQTRQELCESLEYFKSYQGGVYSTGKRARGYLLDGHPAKNDLWHNNGKVIISHGGGHSAMDKETGQVTLSEDQSPGSPSCSALLASWKGKTPIALIVGNGYALFPYNMPENCSYIGLGFYLIAHAWEEPEETKASPRGHFVRWKFLFQWVERQGNPWWWTNEDPVPSTHRLEGRHLLTQTVRNCPTCNVRSVDIYSGGWLCTNSACSSYFFINLYPRYYPSPKNIGYAPGFLALQDQSDIDLQDTSTLDIEPAFPVQQLFNATGEESPQDGTTRPFWKGFFCKECGRLSCREFWTHWECNNCKKQFIVKTLPYSAPPAPSGPAQLDGLRNEGRRRDGKEHFRHLTYVLPENRGTIHLLRAQETDLASVIWKLYQKDAQKQEFFRRYGMKNHKLKGRMLSHYFSQNSGAHYSYVGGTENTVPLDTYESVQEAMKYIQRRATEALGTDPDFNEILSAAYMADQKMEFHSDGESDLGPIVAGLSLGAPATMRFREVPSKWRKAHASGEERRSPPVFLNLSLKHGDMVVMEGADIQEYYQHAVYPEGFRIAATARFIKTKGL
ncbi:hypothetical protein M422DRAFT_225410 [Sphaerobolus stellatus SS14]|nr:hypothetical protein M422DRAFT_225410 [Sphaerobolus stellatus SS14]